MMEIYTPRTDVFHGSAQLPEDLKDRRTAASVRVGIEAALDNAAYVNERLDQLYRMVLDSKTFSPVSIPLNGHIDPVLRPFVPVSSLQGSLELTAWDVRPDESIYFSASFFARFRSANGGGFELKIGDRPVQKVSFDAAVTCMFHLCGTRTFGPGQGGESVKCTLWGVDRAGSTDSSAVFLSDASLTIIRRSRT